MHAICATPRHGNVARLIHASLLFAVLATGCKTTPVNPFTRNKAEPEESALASKSPEPEKEESRRPSLDLTALEIDAWYEQVLPPFAERDPAFIQWRHHRIDPLVNYAPASRPDLSLAISGTNPVVAANAAILMARWGRGSAPALAAAARNAQLKTNLRCAAVEALGMVEQPPPDGTLRELLEEIAPLSPPANGTIQPAPMPELHANLIRALARNARPGDEAWFTAALRSPAWNVRYEGMLAWTAVRDRDLPPLAIDRRSDEDPRVRAAALRAIARHHDTHAVEYLQQGLSDRSIEVHTAAIAALGELGSDQARSMLLKLQGNRSELSRAAAVVALAASGMRNEVEAAARDESHHVRLAVAEMLGTATNHGREVAAQTVATAQTLARDASAEVQRRAIESVADWPLEQAGPVLLLAIAEGGYTARKSAATQLAKRWPPAADFPVDAMAQRREVALAELRRLWTEQYGAINDAVVSAKAEAQQLVTLAADQVQQVRTLIDTLQGVNLSEQVRQQAIAALCAFGPQIQSVLERELAARGALPADVYEHVLPNVNTAFAILTRLESRDELERRAAATELATLASNGRLSPLAIARLADVVTMERDAAVWRAALAAVAQDTSSQAVQMAYTAIGSASGEVRRLACEYLAAHGDPRHAPVLLPALNDSDVTVVLAAVQALGAVRTLDDPAPLVRLLNAPDKHLRLATALSLSRLNYQQGRMALERLALDAELETRLRAAQAMGEIGDVAFYPALVALLADKHDVSRVAMLSLGRIAGVDPAAAADGVPLSHEEKVRRWQLWYREQQNGPIVADARRAAQD